MDRGNKIDAFYHSHCRFASIKNMNSTCWMINSRTKKYEFLSCMLEWFCNNGRNNDENGYLSLLHKIALGTR